MMTRHPLTPPLAFAAVLAAGLVFAVAGTTAAAAGGAQPARASLVEAKALR